MLAAIIALIRAVFVSHARLRIENAVLRYQLSVYQRTAKRPKLTARDRILWSLLSRAATRWRELLYIARPRTVIEWRRRRFRRWTPLCRRRRPGRP